MEVDFLEKILIFHKEKNWREILALNEVDVALARKLLWAWPSENNLQFIKNFLELFGLKGVVSIGCGCGLFEWIFQQYSGFPVVGYEVNETWWKSRYSNPQFIKLNFLQQPPTSELLIPNHALLFCYFNNGEAFRDYIRCFKGHFVIIIGPGPGSGHHTDPEPFEPNFGSSDWLLYKTQEIRDTKDFIAIYAKSKL